MSKNFKINVYFDENSQEIENLISYIIIHKLEENDRKRLSVKGDNE